MHLIDGKTLANNILADLKQVINLHQLSPGLAVILIGNDSASRIYVRNKKKTANTIGVEFHTYLFPNTANQEDIIQTIHFLNLDPEIHGIIVQLPLPQHLNPNIIIQAIDPTKDADGFHPHNLACLLTNNQCPKPVTAMSVMKCVNDALANPSLADQIQNKQAPALSAAIICKSDIFYQPLSILLEKQGIIPHHYTDVSDEISAYDIVIIALGKPQILTKNHINQNAIVIDVGIHHLQSQNHTKKIVGDVNFEDIKTKAGCITPVPGGVGPITVAMLLQNTVNICLQMTVSNKINKT